MSIMAPLSTAEKAAVDGFMKGKRGQRALIGSTSSALVDYFADKGTTLAELPTARPADATDLVSWQEEWMDYAAAAGVTDKADLKNVGRWIIEEDTGLRVGLRSGKAYAVADALAKKGIVLDRAAELAVTAALAAADKGDCRAQCRHVDVVWNLYTGQLRASRRGRRRGKLS